MQHPLISYFLGVAAAVALGASAMMLTIPAAPESGVHHVSAPAHRDTADTRGQTHVHTLPHEGTDALTRMVAWWHAEQRLPHLTGGQ